ncbi:MAG TPA: ornithine cyclodeaminase family protein [Micropepsaceae bacterium]|nr:ornithine cyclodeaminase family protein [Micropepsaceae bacterium]
MTLILSNDDVESVLSMPLCLDALEDAYRELAEGRGLSRRRSDSFAPTSRQDALYSLKSMDGICPKLGVGAVRINSDIITWPEIGGNARRVKVPSAPNQRYVGLVLLFSSETGEPLAIMPDGVMQRLRVGAANGLGVKYLARQDARIVGMLGSGWQAGAQAMAVTAVRSIETIRCFSPTKANREAFATEMSAKLKTRVVPVDSPEEAVKGADIVMCASNTIDPILPARLIEPGQHVSSIKRPELGSDVLKRCDLVFLHSHDKTPLQLTTKGVVVRELDNDRGWGVAKDIDFDALPALAELIAGKHKGRTSRDEVTCFVNNVGLGYQFAAAGAVVYREARKRELGRELPTEWFTEDVHP